MKPNEAVEVMAALMATWPKQWSELTQRIWIKELERLEAEPSEKAVVALIRSSDFAPSMAKFLEAYRSEIRNVRMSELPEPAPDVSPSVAKANLKRMREMIAAMPKHRNIPVAERKHNAESWESCPECRGAS